MQECEGRVAFIGIFAIETFCFRRNGRIVRYLIRNIAKRLNIIHVGVFTLSLF
ncbi:hypothetical protein OZY43_07515 [Lactobacillus sp. ESL0785]|uniref:hypothetical protein n=1 Tax=Lactobacillus sp. ESL0785 TaxID=2983232 RepID=UPI0023F62556|nr:hypothetical protein [Lactobacillus sp. ESL0785]WEV70775.1 hypothetical protein OZY43_07515 [Lactobacillus sp. ESL0785]